MKSEGFTYEPIPYTRPLTAPVDSLAGITDPELSGYGGVYNALTIPWVSHGEPPTGLTEAEIRAYDRALSGSLADEFHAHDNDEGHPEDSTDAPSKGCRSIGDQAIRVFGPNAVWYSTEVGDLYGEFLERVKATREYISFAEDWRLCLERDGREARTDEPGSESIANLVSFSAQADEVLLGHDLKRHLDESEEEYTRRTGLPPVLDSQSYQMAIDRIPELAELAKEERSAAISDEQCRRSNASALVPVADAISLEVFGTSFPPSSS